MGIVVPGDMAVRCSGGEEEGIQVSVSTFVRLLLLNLSRGRQYRSGEQIENFEIREGVFYRVLCVVGHADRRIGIRGRRGQVQA